MQQINGVDVKQETKILNKIDEDTAKAHAQVEMTKTKLEDLISDRTLAALKSNEKLFCADDQKKMTKDYIHKAIKTKFAL